MAVQQQLRRGTQAQVLAFTGAQGELAVDTTNNRLVVQDSLTPGGWSAAKLDETILLKVVVPNINFGVPNADTLVNIPLPPGYSQYLVQNAWIFGATGSLASATCQFWTAAAGAGGALSASTAVTITTAAPNTNNDAMIIGMTNPQTLGLNLPTIYFRVGTASSVVNLASLMLIYLPLF